MVSKVPLRIGSVAIPRGFLLSSVSLAGIDLKASRGRDLEVVPEGEGYRLLDSL